MTMPPQQGSPQPENPHQPPEGSAAGGLSGGTIAGIVGAFAVVVAVVVVGITGFVAPGFFLSDDDEAADGSSDGGADPTTTVAGGAPQPPSEEAVTWMQAFVDRVNAHDPGGAWDLVCDEAADDDNLAQLLQETELYTPVQLIGELKGGAGPDHAAHDLRLTIDGQTHDSGGIAADRQDDGTWCIRAFG